MVSAHIPEAEIEDLIVELRSATSRRRHLHGEVRSPRRADRAPRPIRCSSVMARLRSNALGARRSGALHSGRTHFADEGEGDAVHAVALAGGRGAVVEGVAQDGRRSGGSEPRYARRSAYNPSTRRRHCRAALRSSASRCRSRISSPMRKGVGRSLRSGIRPPYRSCRAGSCRRARCRACAAPDTAPASAFSSIRHRSS